MGSLWHGSLALGVADAGEKCFLQANPAALRLFECPAGEVPGLPLDRFVPGLSDAHWWSTFGKEGEDRASRTVALAGEGRTWQGKSLGLHIIITTFDAPISDACTVLVLMVDLAAIDSASATKLNVHDRYDRLSKAAPALIWVTDASGGCIHVNTAWVEFTGRLLSEENGDGWKSGVHPDDVESTGRTFLENTPFHRPFRVRFRLRRRDGTYRWMMCESRPQFDGRGAFDGYIVSCFDITETVDFDPIPRESDDRFHLLFRETDVAIFWGDLDGRIRAANPAFERMFGFGERTTEMYYTELLDREVEPHQDLHARANLTAMISGVSDHLSADRKYRRADGSTFWGRVVATSVRNDRGEPLFLVCVFTDISESRRMIERRAAILSISERLSAAGNPERAILELLGESRQLLNADNCAVYRLDDEGTLRLVAVSPPPPPEIVESIRVAAAGSFLYKAIAARSPIRIKYVQLPVVPNDDPLPSHLGLTSVVTAPLMSNDRCVGVLSFARAGAQGPFVEEDEALVGLLASQTAAEFVGAARARRDGVLAAARTAQDKLNNGLGVALGYLELAELDGGVSPTARAMIEKAIGAIVDASRSVNALEDATAERLAVWVNRPGDDPAQPQNDPG